MRPAGGEFEAMCQLNKAGLEYSKGTSLLLAAPRSATSGCSFPPSSWPPPSYPHTQFVSVASQRAPEEVHAPLEKGGVAPAETELEREDRKRRRAQKKRGAKKHRAAKDAERAAREQSLGGLGPIAGRKSEQAAAAAAAAAAKKVRGAQCGQEVFWPWLGFTMGSDSRHSWWQGFCSTFNTPRLMSIVER